jgi:hypothetical protein
MDRFAAIPFLAILTAFLFAGGTSAQQNAEPGGWTVTKVDPNSCLSGGPLSGNVSLDIAVIGPELKLLFSSPEFRFADGTYPITISIDGGAGVQLNSLAKADVFSIPISRDLGVAFRSASLLTAAVGGKIYNFRFAHADAAMDAASKCAGEPSFVEFYSHPPAEIPNADGWRIVDNIQGSKRCSIRKNSEQVDTSIIYRGNGGILLVAGRADWALRSQQVKVAIQIDGSPPLDFDGSTFDNLVLVPVVDPKIQNQLEQAKQLLWHLPWGDFQADVDGLPVALKALEDCDTRRAATAQ